MRQTDHNKTIKNGNVKKKRWSKGSQKKSSIKKHSNQCTKKCYAKIDGQTTWRWQGWNHPLIAPVDEYNVQVHHFKWDSTCVDRIKAVADIKKEYSYSDEYLKMYQAIRRNNFQIDIDNPEFMIENDGFSDYGKWNILLKKIISI